VLRLLAVAALALPAAAPSQAAVQPLSPRVRQMLLEHHVWRAGCPVALSGLRELSVRYHGFDGRTHTGTLVVSASAAGPLSRVFARLYALHLPIHHMSVGAAYGPVRGRPRDGDVTESFSCRQAVPSPCLGGTGTGSWSMHAFGLAVDVNPVENPYVGCGQSRDPSARPFFDRSRHRRGMVTARDIGAFASIGWGWGGSWAGDTKDYMHFSANGH